MPPTATPEPLEVATARAFVQRAVLPVVAGPEEGNDARLQSLLAGARGAGLLASADDGDASESALWGKGLEDLASSAILAEVGRACAGSGLVLHTAALGIRLAGDTGQVPSGRVLVAVPVAPRCPPLEVLESPAASGGAWVPDGVGAVNLSASYPLVWGVHDERATTVLVFARAGAEWVLVRARTDDAGAFLRPDERPRLGLRMCPVVRVTLDRVSIPPAIVLARGADARALLFSHLRRFWLGLGAIAAGAAAGAVEDAARFATERVQGGAAIARHAAVQSLLGEAGARAASARAAIDAACARPGLPDAAAARLAATADAALAVGNALQVLGGVGYMEDYPLAKRLRDIESLRVMRRIVAAAAAAAGAGSAP